MGAKLPVFRHTRTNEIACMSGLATARFRATVAQYPFVKYTLAMKWSWLTRPLFIVPTKVRRSLLLLVGLFILLVAFAPGLWTVSWHVVHGNTMIYRTKKIHVPMRWLPIKAEPQSALIEKLPATVLPFKPILPMISL